MAEDRGRGRRGEGADVFGTDVDVRARAATRRTSRWRSSDARAADQGNAHATHQLGVQYLRNAVGVEQDLDKAIEHFDKAIELGSADAVKDREIAQKKKKMSFTRGIKKQISGLPMIGRSKSKRNTVESSLRIKAASAPLKSPSSSRQTSRQSTPAQSPVASPTSQPAFEEEEAVPSPTAGAKRPAPPPLPRRRSAPRSGGPRRRAAAEAAETPPRPRPSSARTRGAPPAAAAPERALRKFAFAYGAIVLLGVGLAVASEACRWRAAACSREGASKRSHYIRDIAQARGFS